MYDAQVDTLEEELLMDGDEAGDASRKLRGTENNLNRKAYTSGGNKHIDINRN